MISTFLKHYATFSCRKNNPVYIHCAISFYVLVVSCKRGLKTERSVKSLSSCFKERIDFFVRQLVFRFAVTFLLSVQLIAAPS